MAQLVEQRFEKVPISWLKQHPLNPNIGNVDLIRESIVRNGFFGAIVVQTDGVVLAGWHRAKVFGELGGTEVDAMIVDPVDDEHALRILSVDNAANRAGHFDFGKLADVLSQLQPGGLEGSGMTNADLAEALRKSDRYGDKASGFLDDERGGQDADDGQERPDDEQPADDDQIWFTLTYVVGLDDVETVRSAIRSAKADLGDSREQRVTSGQALARICRSYAGG